jgi:formylmethanofuran dehydrogenase subunit C
MLDAGCWMLDNSSPNNVEHRASSIQTMPLKFTYTANTPIPVEIEGLTPDWACDKSLAEIERFEIFHGNRKLPLAEMFQVAGDPSDSEFHFEGNLAGVHWIGAHMHAGRITIHSPAGRHVGSAMRGGEIHVHGSAGDWLGAEMHGGLIHVQGSAGHLAGAAYRGSPRGMTGGTLLVDGDAGNEVGLSMRRGLLAIGGAVGDLLGFNMIAGTIVVLGKSGARPGAGMRRGTIALLGNATPLLPSFRYACTAQPFILPLVLRSLRDKGMRIDDALLHANVDLYNGDLIELGKGEIFLRNKQAA